MVEKGRAVGPSTADVLEKIMESGNIRNSDTAPASGSCVWENVIPTNVWKQPARRAIAMNVCSYRSIKSILENSLDREPLTPVEVPAAHEEVHPNVRGSSYYHKEKEEVA